MIPLQTNSENVRTQLTMLEDTNLSPRSLPTYNSNLKMFFEWAEINDAKEFLEVPDNDLQTLMDMYVKHLRNRVENNEISPNTVPKVFKPFRKLLDVNYRENAVKWKPIYAQFPAEEKLSGYKPWESSQIEMMLDSCKNLRETALVTFHSSTGARVGVHDHSLLFKHMVQMDTPDGGKCYAFLIYADPDETVEEKDTRNSLEVIDEHDYSHFVFTNPEASIALDNYHAKRMKGGEIFTPDTCIFQTLRVNKWGKLGQMSGNGFQKTMQRILPRTPITRIKKRNRFDVQIDHGFRKRFNTILKIDSEVNSNIAEKLMQHKKGLDGVYLTPTRFQCFTEFIKAIPQLTVSEKQRQRILLNQKQSKIDELQVKNNRIEVLEDQVSVLSKQARDQVDTTPDTPTKALIMKILKEKKII